MTGKMISALLATIGSLCAVDAQAACEVFARSLSQKIPTVVEHSCYTYEGMEEQTAIKWSCSQEDDVGMFDYEKTLVDHCPSGHFASCTSTLTQESLANHNAIGDLKAGTPLVIPDGATMVTYFYGSEEKQQAKQNCTALGGNWQERRGG
nr:hypothetical protein [uncultured Pseudomonas sp.]